MAGAIPTPLAHPGQRCEPPTLMSFTPCAFGWALHTPQVGISAHSSQNPIPATTTATRARFLAPQSMHSPRAMFPCSCPLCSTLDEVSQAPNILDSAICVASCPINLHHPPVQSLSNPGEMWVQTLHRSIRRGCCPGSADDAPCQGEDLARRTAAWG